MKPNIFSVLRRCRALVRIKQNGGWIHRHFKARGKRCFQRIGYVVVFVGVFQIKVDHRIDHGRVGNGVVSLKLGVNFNIECFKRSAHPRDDVGLATPKATDAHCIGKFF